MLRLNRRDFPGAHYSIDWQLDWLNQHQHTDAGVVVVRPRNRKVADSLNQQDGLYTTLIRGLDTAGQRVSETRLIRSVNREIQPYQQFDAFLALARAPQMRFVFSNTTEAGIAFTAGDWQENQPAASFPGKLTQLLWARFQHFAGAADKGWLIVPCELIDHNGDRLRELVLRYIRHWQLPTAFAQWVTQHCAFYNTLVDRIVTGYPDDGAAIAAQLGYEDRYLVAGEVYYQFVLQGPEALMQELQLAALAPAIKRVADITPYKAQKVAILNGAHTALVPVAFLAGLESVGEAMDDAEMAAFIDALLRNEIIPTLDLPRDELEAFTAAVIRRFRNPFIRHALLSIALNGMTKFRTRLLPPLLQAQQQTGRWPVHLTFALAALLAFYRGEQGDRRWPLQDDESWLQRFALLWPPVTAQQKTPEQLVHAVLSEAQHWDEDLTQRPGLVAAVSEHLNNILVQGMRTALNALR